jgi:hypothetical protein
MASDHVILRHRRIGAALTAVLFLGVMIGSAGPAGAAADPTFGPDRRLSQVDVAQSQVAIATDGDGHLAVWTDLRGIYGTRMDRDGRVLDPQGIAISTAASAYQPSVVFTGTDYLVVWVEGVTSNANIVGARVGTDGTVKDSPAVTFSNATGRQDNPAVAFDGSTALVVWRDNRNATADIYGTRWTVAGGVRDPTGIAVATGATNQVTPAVVSYGSAFLAAWVAADQVAAARVEADGDVLDPGGFALAAGPQAQESPALAFDGTNVLAVWIDFRDSIGKVFGARWNPSSGVLAPGAFAISPAPFNASTPALAFNKSYLVVWKDSEDDISGARVETDGTVTDPNGFTVVATDKIERDPAVVQARKGQWITTWDRNSRAHYRFVSPK